MNPVRESHKRGNGPEAGSGREPHHSPVGPGDAASYIHELAIELTDIAESGRHLFLAYLLSLVVEESSPEKRDQT